MPCKWCHAGSGDLDFCSTDCYEEYQSQSVSTLGEHHAHDSTEEGQEQDSGTLPEQPHESSGPGNDAAVPF